MINVDDFEWIRITSAEVIDAPQLSKEIKEFARRAEIFQCYAITLFEEDAPKVLGTSIAVYAADVARICLQYEDYVGWYDVEEVCTREDDEGIENAVTVWIFDLRTLLGVGNLRGTYNDAVHAQLAQAPAS